jgi:hypothetical protein
MMCQNLKDRADFGATYFQIEIFKLRFPHRNFHVDNSTLIIPVPWSPWNGVDVEALVDAVRDDSCGRLHMDMTRAQTEGANNIYAEYPRDRYRRFTHPRFGRLALWAWGATLMIDGNSDFDISSIGVNVERCGASGTIHVAGVAGHGRSPRGSGLRVFRQQRAGVASLHGHDACGQ